MAHVCGIGMDKMRTYCSRAWEQLEEGKQIFRWFEKRGGSKSIHVDKMALEIEKRCVITQAHWEGRTAKTQESFSRNKYCQSNDPDVSYIYVTPKTSA